MAQSNEQVTDQPTVSQHEAAVQTSILVPFDLWITVKNEAATRRTSAADLYVKGVRLLLGIPEPDADTA